MNFSRRSFLTKSAKGAAVMAGIPAIVSSCIPEKETKNGKFEIIGENDVILFQGDSITDAGRNKQNEMPNNNNAFGTGYAYLAGSKLLNDFPDRKLNIYNRGISGNKVYQLAERWQNDCFDLKPNLLSILIGVNDYWHMRNEKFDGTVEVYENDFVALIEQTKAKLPDVSLIICQPFIVNGTSAVDDSWIEPFKKYQDAAKRVANQFDAIWVPFQEVFDKAVELAEPTYWTGDGVHPSMAGCQLMAEAWLQSIK